MKKNFSYTKEKMFINDNYSKLLIKKFDEIFNGEVYFSGYSNIRSLNTKQILKEKTLISLKNKIQQKFKTITGIDNLVFSKLWLVNSKPNDTNKNILPYIPHIDKLRYFKAMVYLHDVTIKHGPIHFGKAKNKMDVESKRINLPSDYKEKGLNSISSAELKQSLIGVTGKKGDTIFFDTNTPHKGGVISKGYQRKILRFDFERPGDNTKLSNFKKILKIF